MFFKGIAIFFIIYRSIEVELIKSKRATHFDFWVTLFFFLLTLHHIRRILVGSFPYPIADAESDDAGDAE